MSSEQISTFWLSMCLYAFGDTVDRILLIILPIYINKTPASVISAITLATYHYTDVHSFTHILLYLAFNYMLIQNVQAMFLWLYILFTPTPQPMRYYIWHSIVVAAVTIYLYCLGCAHLTQLVGFSYIGALIYSFIVDFVFETELYRKFTSPSKTTIQADLDELYFEAAASQPLN